MNVLAPLCSVYSQNLYALKKKPIAERFIGYKIQNFNSVHTILSRFFPRCCNKLFIFQRSGCQTCKDDLIFCDAKFEARLLLSAFK